MAISPEIRLPVEHPLLTDAALFVSQEAQRQLAVVQSFEDDGEFLYDYPKDEADRRREMIYLKIIHSSDALEAAVDIANSDSGVDAVLAQFLGQIHDVGRFEQSALFGTFSDGKSGYDHALMGAHKFQTAGIQVSRHGYEDSVIADAIVHHSAYQYRGENDAARLIRDIDKLALLRRSKHMVRMIVSSGAFEHAPPGELAEDVYRQGLLVSNDMMHTTGDAILCMCSWKHDINLDATNHLIASEEWIEKLEAVAYSFV